MLPGRSASLTSADLSRPESIGTVVTAVGTEPLDLLVYSAAQWESDPSISATTETEMADLVNVSLTSFISIVQHLAQPLSTATRAVVVVLGSTAGLSKQAAGRPGYAAAKAGLRSACLALNQQFAGTSVTVTCLSLGAIGPTDRAPDASARISYASIGATIDYLAGLSATATVTEIVMPGRDFDSGPGTDG